MKILLVEDEPELCANVGTFLRNEAVVCEIASNYGEALEKLGAFDYDIVVLDIMLPDGNGLDILRRLKQDFIETGVLIISAKNSLDDKLTGFDLGADDYLTKPFHLSELNARLKALYRRRKFKGQQLLYFEEIEINTDERKAKIKQQELDLTQKEYDLLVYFLANRNRVLTKQAIAEHLWGDYVDHYDHFDFVYQHIKNLRKKMHQAGSKPYIATVYGLGYKFNTNQS